MYCQHEFPKLMNKCKQLVERWRSSDAHKMFPKDKRAVAEEVMKGCAEALEKVIKESEFGP
jgi:hypothetical protein